MINNSPQLTDVFGLASERYKALVENYLAAAQTKQSFLSEEFVNTTYQDHVTKILNQIRHVFIRQYTDFNGTPLIAENELVLSLDSDAVTANAYVISTGTDRIEITITLGLVILIDLLTAAKWVYITEILPMESNPTPSFNTACSTNLATILKYNLSQGLTERAKVRLAGFFTTADESMRKDWERMTSLSLLWVLSHEVGHFLCGHVGYYQLRNGILGISEKSAGAELEVMIGGADSSSITKWACELMADIYATIRVGWIVCQEVKEQKLDLSISRLINSIIVSSILPGVAFLLERKQKRASFLRRVLYREKQADILKEFYPSEWCRIFSAFATVVFLAYPLENASLDPRKNPLESFWEENLLTDWKLFLVAVLEIFESIDSFLRVFNLTPFSLEESEQIAENFCGSVISARNGLVTLQTSSLKTDTSLSPHLAQWAYTMKALCTETNLYFSAHLKKSWMTRGVERLSPEMIRDDFKKHADVLMKIGGMANDPAYKILDDWMSQIYETWQCEEDEIMERIRECALHGWHVVDIRRRL